MATEGRRVDGEMPVPSPAAAVRRSGPAERPSSHRRGPERQRPSRIARRLGRAGPHTLAVSLPRSWLLRHGLERGDTVWLALREDGRIEVAPAAPGAPADLPGPCLTVRSPHFEEPDELARTVFGAYVVGYERIELVDEEGFGPGCRSRIEATARSLLGLETVLSEPHTVTLVSFLDVGKDTIPKIVARSGTVVDEMAEMLADALRTGTPRLGERLGERLRERESEADRLYALTLRQLMLAQQDPVLARALRVEESRDLLGNRVVAKVLEEIADLLCRAGPELRTGLAGRAIPATLRANLVSHLEGLRGMVREALHALGSGDSAGAHRVLRERDRSVETLRATEAILARARLPRRQTAALAVVAWGLATAGRLCGTIAEVALNASLHSTGLPRADGGPLPPPPTVVRSTSSAPGEGRQRSSASPETAAESVLPDGAPVGPHRLRARPSGAATETAGRGAAPDPPRRDSSRAEEGRPERSGPWGSRVGPGPPGPGRSPPAPYRAERAIPSGYSCAMSRSEPRAL